MRKYCVELHEFYWYVFFVALANEYHDWWDDAAIEFSENVRFFYFTAYRGGSTSDEDEGDIAIDNIQMFNYFRCRRKY